MISLIRGEVTRTGKGQKITKIFWDKQWPTPTYGLGTPNQKDCSKMHTKFCILLLLSSKI